MKARFRAQITPVGDQGSNVLQGFFFILAAVIGDAADFIVRGRASQRFVVNGLANGCFDQIAAGQENGARSFHNDALVAHDGEVGATRHATAHHGSDLRDPS